MIPCDVERAIVEVDVFPDTKVHSLLEPIFLNVVDLEYWNNIDGVVWF